MDQPLGEDRVVVIGAGGHAKTVIAMLQEAGWLVEIAFDDRIEGRGGTLLGVPIRGPIEAAQAEHGRRAVIAVGDNTARRSLAARLPLKWVAAIHPMTCIHATANIEAGAVIAAGAIVQPDARIGEHAIVNTGASVDHDSQLGDFAHAAPGVRIAGGVKVGAGTLLGVGASIAPGVSIGENARIGAGATVITDLPANCTAVGTPAKIVRLRKPTGSSAA